MTILIWLDHIYGVVFGNFVMDAEKQTFISVVFIIYTSHRQTS